MSLPAAIFVPLKLLVIDDTVEGTVRSSRGSKDGRNRESGRRAETVRNSFLTKNMAGLSRCPERQGVGGRIHCGRGVWGEHERARMGTSRAARSPGRGANDGASG